jgi:predicted RND superfamily exporter protein
LEILEIVMMQWMELHEGALVWLGVVSLLTFIGTLVVIPVLVIRIPEDYFTRATRHPSRWRDHHPAIRLTVLVIKNVLGCLFLLAGIAMLFLPGQGILTILVGITLINFPGKMAMERWLIRHRPVYRAINWLRTRAHHSALEIPEKPAR